MKYLHLSEQDQDLLLHLHRHIYLSREFIDQYIYTRTVTDAETDGEKSIKAHEMSVYRRLGKLKEAGYITSFPLPITKGSGRPSNVYTLDQFGVATVEQMTGIVHWNQKWSKEPPVWYMHTLTLAEVVKSFEKHAPSAGLVVKEFISEAKAHFKFYTQGASKQPENNVIRPDGILIIGLPDNDDNNVGVMIEMERSYADRAGTIRKLNQYNKFFGMGNSEEKYLETLKNFDLKVGFEHPVQANNKFWKILFIGDNGSMGKRILKQLKGLKCEVKLVAASKDDLMKDPFDKVYYSLKNPEAPTTL